MARTDDGRQEGDLSQVIVEGGDAGGGQGVGAGAGLGQAAAGEDAVGVGWGAGVEDKGRGDAGGVGEVGIGHSQPGQRVEAAAVADDLGAGRQADRRGGDDVDDDRRGVGDCAGGIGDPGDVIVGDGGGDDLALAGAERRRGVDQVLQDSGRREVGRLELAVVGLLGERVGGEGAGDLGCRVGEAALAGARGVEGGGEADVEGAAGAFWFGVRRRGEDQRIIDADGAERERGRPAVHNDGIFGVVCQGRGQRY